MGAANNCTHFLFFAPMRWILPIILFIVLSGCRNTDRPTPIEFDAQPYLVAPKHYIIHHASGITIDGIADEPDWEITPYTDPFIDIQNADTPAFMTRVKMLWDTAYLYIFAELEEPHISASLKNRDAVIFYDNDFEVFLDPQGNTFNYYEIEINAFGTVWDLKLDRAYSRLGNAETHFDIPGLKSAVAINGTINDASDVDQGWSVEMAIPLDAICERISEKFPDDGVQWRMNFSRVEWQHDFIDGSYVPLSKDGKRLPERNWVWSRQGEINMHLPENWGYVQFSDFLPGNDVGFSEPPDLISRQVLFTLLRQVDRGNLHHLKNLEPYSEQAFMPFEANGQSFDALFVKTHTGFEMKLTNKDIGKTFVINEIGQIKELK